MATYDRVSNEGMGVRVFAKTTVGALSLLIVVALGSFALIRGVDYHGSVFGTAHPVVDNMTLIGREVSTPHGSFVMINAVTDRVVSVPNSTIVVIDATSGRVLAVRSK